MRLVFIFSFAFMLIESVSAKWHYLIDLPFGIAFGFACFWGADRLLRYSEKRHLPL